MIVTTTQSVEGYRVTGYYGIVFGEVVTGVNFLRDIGAGLRKNVFRRQVCQDAKTSLNRRATRHSAKWKNAPPRWARTPSSAFSLDYEVLGAGDMLMVTASGTAVTVEKA